MKHERPCLVASGSDWLQEVLRRLLVWVVVLSSGTLMAYAGNLDISQTKVITGTVTEKETGDPLIGVNVSVKGTSKGTITNLNGQYSVFSFLHRLIYNKVSFLFSLVLIY